MALCVCVVVRAVTVGAHMRACKHLLKHSIVWRNSRTRCLGFRERGVVMWSSAERRDGQYGFWWGERRVRSRICGLGHGGDCKSDVGFQ